MKVLLDTCTITEVKKPKPDTRVIAALKDIPNEKLFLSVVSLGEIVKGIGLLASGKRRDELTAWLTATQIDPSSMGTAAVALVSAGATILARIGAAQ